MFQDANADTDKAGSDLATPDQADLAADGDAPDSRGDIANRLLAVLKDEIFHYVLPADLDERLSVRREALFDAFEHLRECGYHIEFHPYFGFRLADIPSALTRREIVEELNTKLLARDVTVVQSTGATADLAWDIVEKAAPTPEGIASIEGKVVVAEEQLRGRGRFGRAWFSPKGKGIWMSVVLTPGVTPEAPYYCQAIGTLAIANTLNLSVHLPAEVRWPNDIYVGPRKIGAVHVDRRADRPGVFVTSLLLNVSQHAVDFPDNLRDRATSIRMESGDEPNRNRLIRSLVFYLDTLYQSVRKRRYKPIDKTWREYSALINKEILIADRAHEVRGEVVDLHPADGIKVKVAGGAIEHFDQSNVTLLRLLQ